MRYRGEDFEITFDKNDRTLYFRGSMQLRDSREYQKIKQFMLDVHHLDLPSLTLDFRDLEFLNSSGINMLSKFVIRMKNLDRMPIKVTGSRGIPWQYKSLHNLKLLWENIDLEFR